MPDRSTPLSGGEAVARPFVTGRATLAILAVLAAVFLLQIESGVAALGVLLVAVLVLNYEWIGNWPTMLGALVAIVLLVPTSMYLPVGLDAPRAVVLAFLGVWGMALLADPRISLRRTPLDWPLRIFVLAVAVSLVVNVPDFTRGLGFNDVIRRTAYLAVFVALFHAVVTTLRKHEEAQRLISLIVGLGVVLGFVALFQRLTSYNVLEHLDSFVPVLQQIKPEGTSLIRAGGLRVTGAAGHPIAFAATLGMIAALALARLATARDGRQQALYATAVGIIGVAMILSGSRTAFVSLAASSLVLLLVLKRGRGRLLVTLAAVAVLVYMLFPGVLGTMLKWMTPSYIMEQEVDNPAGRIADYPRMMEYFWRRPALGMGYGVFDPLRFFFVDNQYLKFLVEIGLIGLSAFVWLLASAGRWMVRAARERSADVSADLLGVVAGLAVFAAVCLTFDTFGFPQMDYLFFILLGTGAALALPEREELGLGGPS